MTLVGNVLNSSVETRELVGKDGVKRSSKISHVLVSLEAAGGGVEILNVRAYDATWELPKIGAKWTTPRIKRYECFDGQVADVTV